MKKWLIISGLAFIFLLVAYWFIFKFAVPKMSEAFIPPQWQQVPLGKKRNVALDYLGTPNNTTATTDEWRKSVTKEKSYVLTIEYNKDTVVAKYKLVYEFRFLGMKHEALLRKEKLE
jgi:hypothetical protein